MTTQVGFLFFLQGVMMGAILNGAWFRPIPIRQRKEEIAAQIDYFKPHILFCHMIFSEDLRLPGTIDVASGQAIILKREEIHQILAKSRKKWDLKVVYQEGDAKVEPRFPFPAFGIIDLALINNRMTDQYSNALQVPCVHWPYFALNQDEVSVPLDRFKHDMVFTGNVSIRNPEHLHYRRYEFIQDIQKHLDLKIYPDDKIGNTRFLTSDISASVKSVLGIQHGHKVLGYLDTRPFQYIGSGALYFHDECDQIKQFFEPDVHFLQYQSMDVKSLVARYEEMMRRPDLVDTVKREGFRYCQAYHTAKSRVKMVIDILDGKEPQKIYLNEIRK